MAGIIYHLSAVGVFLLAPGICAQTLLPLSDASSRKRPDFAPLHQGESIRVRGTVAAPPVLLPEYAHTIIQDRSGAGLTLEATSAQVTGLSPGAQVEAVGVLHERAGLPVLRVADLDVIGSGEPPQAQPMTVADLTRIDSPGRFVITEAHVLWAGQNSGGDILAIGSGQANVVVFLPFSGRKRSPALARYHPGDRVRVQGISAQYCPFQPYDRGFELIIRDPADVTLLAAAWLISPSAFVWGLLGVIFLIVMWSWRERNLGRQRTVLRGITTLAEEVIAAESPVAIARRLESAPYEIFRAASVEIYLHSEGAEQLDRVVTEKCPEPLSIPLDSPTGPVRALAAVCFRNRAMIAVPNVRNSPLVDAEESDLPSSAIVAPMLAGGDVLGVIALFHKRGPGLGPDYQLAIQHLANQVAASMKLQEQRLMKEQLLRSEKMAAAGQLISGVANDLRVPLANISRASRQLLDRATSGIMAELREISSEAERGIDLVDHLLSFSEMERREPKLVDIHALLSRLLDLRVEEQKRRGIQAESQIPLTPVDVLADQGQLEQALLTAIVHAEHAASSAADRRLLITSRIIGTQIHLVFESPTQHSPDEHDRGAVADYFGFPVAQAILQSHGGDLTAASEQRAGTRLEAILPIHTPRSTVGEAGPRPGKPSRVMTAVIVEPDTTSQRRLLALLAARSHRAIPVATPEDAADLVQRMQFDVLFCASRISGLTWVELYHRVRRRVGVFALLTDGYDPEAAQAFANGEGQVLAKPVDERALDNILAVVELRWAVSRH